MAIHASELSIINEALNKLGQQRITSAQLTTPDNRISRLVVDGYENHRNVLLEDHPWNFAIQRSQIYHHFAPVAVVSISAATPNVVTTATNHGYATGDQVFIWGSAREVVNKLHFTIKVLSATTFELDGTTSNGSSGSGGNVAKELAPMPSFRFNYYYLLPDGNSFFWPDNTPNAKCLRVLTLNDTVVWQYTGNGWYLADDIADFKVESGQILTDIDEPLGITYLRLVTDASEMTAMFKDLLSSKLAMEWAGPLTASDSLTSNLTAVFERKLRESRSIDGQEGVPDAIQTNSWIYERMT